MSLAQLVHPFAQSQPDAPALVYGSTTLSYANLARVADAAAGFLRQHHVVPGHMVCVGLAPADHWSWIFVLGAWRAGAVPVLLGDTPVAQIRALGGSGVVVVGTAGSKLLRLPDIRPVAVSADDKQSLAATQSVIGLFDAAVADARAGLVVFGGGAQPLAAALDRKTLTDRAHRMAQLLALDTHSKLWPLLPVDATLRAELAVAVWQRGGTLVLAPAQAGDKAAAKSTSPTGFTHFVSSPKGLEAALRQGVSATAEHRCRVTVVGGPLSVALVKTGTDRFGTPPAQWLYSNESGVYATGDAADFAAHAGCVGRALADAQMAFLARTGAPAAAQEAGLMTVRTPWTAQAYLRGTPVSPSAGLYDGCFRTGLLGRAMADGRLCVLGPADKPAAAVAKPASAPGARQWNRSELEKAVQSLAGVQEACVLTQPGIAGRASVPAIVYASNAADSDPDTLQRAVQQLLGNGQRFHLIKVPLLPRMDDGAVDRDSLAASVTQAVRTARQHKQPAPGKSH